MRSGQVDPCGCQYDARVKDRLVSCCAEHSTHAPMTILVSEQKKQEIWEPLLHYIKVFNGVKE